MSLYVAFRGVKIGIHTSAPEVLTSLTDIYREMLVSTPSEASISFEVHREGWLYSVSQNRVEIAGGETLSNVIEHLNVELTRTFIQAHRDLLWFHAGAAEFAGHTIMLPGPSGGGKSTIVTGLCSRGWKFLSDDVTPLDLRTGRLIPFPRLPRVRRSSITEMPRRQLRRVRKTMVDIEPHNICRTPAAVHMLVFPRYASSSSAADLTPCPPARATLMLLENCLNFINHSEAAMDFICGLTQRSPAFHLSFHNMSCALTSIIKAGAVL